MRNITTFDLTLLKDFKKIYVLVSGGIDSTYLYELIKEKYPNKTIPVNNYNPFERSETLKQISRDPKFIETKDPKKINYSEILKKSFQMLEKALNTEKKKRKKLLPCCRLIKKHYFITLNQFKQKGTVVVSGLKRRDSFNRAMILMSLVDGKMRTRGVVVKDPPTFFHKHKHGQLYCYPFRDYDYRELPERVVSELRKIYPTLTHSSCEYCPMVLLNQIKHEKESYRKSLKYARKVINEYYTDKIPFKVYKLLYEVLL
jgi:tRNA(Ile)-lysidine synthase TilS/MesJ